MPALCSLATLVALVTGWALPTAAHAQGQRRDSTQALEAVTVTAPRRASVAGGVSVLAARLDSLHTEPAPTLEMALRRLPFVQVRTNSRGEAELSVRGSESRSPAIFLDGVPLTAGWDGRTDPGLIPLSGAATLRISRSMTSVLAGANAVGGTVDVSLASSPVERASIGMASSVDQLGSAVVAGSIQSPFVLGNADASLRAGVSFRDRPALARPRDVEDPFAPSGERTNSDLRSLDAFGAGQLSGGSGEYVRLGVALNRAERGVQPELHVSTPRLWRYPSADRAMATLGTGTGARPSPFGRGTVSVDASVGVHAGTTEINSYADASYGAPTGRETGDERAVTSRIVASHTLPGNARVRVGGSFSGIRYLERINADPRVRYAQRLWNLGAEADLPVTGNVTLSSGVGLDGARNPETGGRPPLGAREAWTGRLGITADAGSVRWHAAASHRSRFPSLRELYSGALGRFEPNPALRPEHLTTVEAGATGRTGALELQGVLFHQVNADGVVRITRPDRKFFRINRDEIRSVGVELAGSWSSGGVSVFADALLQRVRVHDATIGGSPRRAEHVPGVRATIGAVLPVVAHLSANAWLTHTGAQYCTHPESGSAVRLAAGTRVDVGVDRVWGIARGWFREIQASVNLANVVDAAVYDQCGLPQPGRTLRAGLALR